MNIQFDFVDGGWNTVIEKAASVGHSDLLIICPFIKLRTVKRLLARTDLKSIRILTRFNLAEMCIGVSDVEALRYLLAQGAKIRGIRNLHAKMYIFGTKNVVVTSANLTEAAFLRNHEFGFVTNDGTIIKRCNEYFESLWRKAGNDLANELLNSWETRIAKAKLTGLRPIYPSDLTDEGADAGIAEPLSLSLPVADGDSQAFIKFFGEGNYRSLVSLPVFDEVKRTGCHWACSYPPNRRPRSVKDGDLIFMARMVKRPNDMMIYGRARAWAHVPGRDEATKSEIALRDFKKDWPIYARVYGAEFVAGALENGIRLSRLMRELKHNTWHSTQRNYIRKQGNLSPNASTRQQAGLMLTKESEQWLNCELEKAFSRFGKISPAELETLDWPDERQTTV